MNEHLDKFGHWFGGSTGALVYFAIVWARAAALVLFVELKRAIAHIGRGSTESKL